MLFKHLRPHSSLQKNVHLIAVARVVLWLFAQAFLVVNHFFLSLDVNLLLAQGILSLFAISAAATFIQARSQQFITEQMVRLQLVLDVVIMSLLFHFTGGAANPFVSIMLFPLIISASILPGRFTWFMVVLTLSFYGSLFMPSLQPSPAMPEHHQHGQASQSAFSLHIIGMWFNFAISAVLISFFVVKMRQEIDQQQVKINAQREQALRDEQLLGIATQAASAAHHMSTPLSTMAIIVNDLQRDEQSAAFRDDLNVLADQVKNCKHVLEGLRHQAAFEKQAEPVLAFLTKLLDEFRLLRPATVLEEYVALDSPASALDTFSILSDPALRMAILNVLNNAADASPERIQLKAFCEQQKLGIDVVDSGAGFTSSAGLTPVESTKSGGLGLGLFLSHATINRHGGEISISPERGNGTRVRIRLPLERQANKGGNNA